MKIVLQENTLTFPGTDDCNYTTAKSIKLITRYEKLAPLISFSVFYKS